MYLFLYFLIALFVAVGHAAVTTNSIVVVYEPATMQMNPTNIAVNVKSVGLWPLSTNSPFRVYSHDGGLQVEIRTNGLLYVTNAIDTGGLTVRSTRAGSINLYDTSGLLSVQLYVADSLPMNVTLMLPTNNPTAGQVMASRGDGTLAWSNQIVTLQTNLVDVFDVTNFITRGRWTTPLRITGAAVNVSAGAVHLIQTNADFTVTFSGTPGPGDQWTLITSNNGVAPISITIPSSYSANYATNITSIALTNGAMATLSWYTPNGSLYYLWHSGLGGSSGNATTNNLPVMDFTNIVLRGSSFGPWKLAGGGTITFPGTTYYWGTNADFTVTWPPTYSGQYWNLRVTNSAATNIAVAFSNSYHVGFASNLIAVSVQSNSAAWLSWATPNGEHYDLLTGGAGGGSGNATTNGLPVMDYTNSIVRGSSFTPWKLAGGGAITFPGNTYYWGTNADFVVTWPPTYSGQYWNLRVTNSAATNITVTFSNSYHVGFASNLTAVAVSSNSASWLSWTTPNSTHYDLLTGGKNSIGTFYPSNNLAMPSAIELGVGGYWIGNSNGYLVTLYTLDGTSTVMKILAP